MRVGRIVAAAAIGAAALAVGPLVQTASAAVTTTSSGTQITVHITGDGSADFSCISSLVAVNSATVSPTVACTALTQVNVTGDSGSQEVYGQDLDGSKGFTAVPRIVASMGDGSDYVTETLANDQINMGPGDDELTLRYGGATNTSIDLGTGSTDALSVEGTPLDDTMTATSTNATASVVTHNSSGSSTSSGTNADYLYLDGNAGNDHLLTTGVTASSSVSYVRLDGGVGDDTLTSGPVSAELYGDAGTNTFNGGTGNDTFWTQSPTDVLNGGNDAHNEYIYDGDSLHSGGRTLSGFTSLDTYTDQTHQGDVVMRVRPGTAGGNLLTTSLTRNGQQVLPIALGHITLGQSYVGALPHKGLADVVAGTSAVSTTLASTGGGLLDVTIPSGTWTVSHISTTVAVTSSYAQVSATYVDDTNHYRVHGPWTNKNQGFAHRSTRDLLFRFPTDAQRDQVRDQLTAGTKTRAQVTAAIMNTDEYRGLDVDRVFLKYLHRTSDASGRTYWINSLRGGKSLTQFRAQLFGSNEYYSKAGGSNGRYMQQAYEDIMGREPDPSGQAYWTGKLDDGTDRGVVARSFLASTEARRNVVKDQFLRFIDRYPTDTEASTWVTKLAGPTGEQDLIAYLVNSNAYFNES